MPHEISPNIEMTPMELQELLDYNVDDELPIDSNLRYFTSEATEQRCFLFTHVLQSWSRTSKTMQP